VPKRFAVMRDLQDHLEAGRISLFDLGVYTVIHWQADFKTGVWRGSAPKIHATGPRGASLRDIQRSIQTLTRIGFLRTFHKHGQRGNYPAIISKFQPLSGALRGKRLNAVKSDDWRRPVYESCVLTDALTDAVPDAEDAPIHNAVCSTQEKPKAKAAKTAPPSDPRFQAFVDFAFGSFEVKHGQRPNWNGKDFKNLKALLSKNQTLTADELKRRWEHYLNSTEPFTAKQADSLAYFCSKFDSFIDGPVQASNGNANTKFGLAYIEALAGAGPEIPDSGSCRACGRTKTYHMRAQKHPKNVLREDPKWQPHTFVTEALA
jgi:hypothetical protein